MSKLLWKPSLERSENANITRYRHYINDEFSLHLDSYCDLYHWSVNNIPEFWGSVWNFVGIVSSQKYERRVDDLSKFPGTKWFPGARLNFAENLLKFKDDQSALIYSNEDGIRASLTYKELNRKVAQLADSLKAEGIVPGDRIAAYMPNQIETIVAMLASAAVGATWASCGAELGPVTVLDRIGQIAPKILFTVDGYSYKGKKFSTISSAERLVEGIPSLEKIIMVNNLGSNSHLPKTVSFADYLSGNAASPSFEQLPFDHPMYVMFSSGTTGKPKSIVQGAGGVLLNHLKELVIHSDLRRNDRITYIASPSWMMWNWMCSSLGVGATVLLYDGDPTYPTWETMWSLIQNQRISIFGCSASYINYLRGLKVEPRIKFDMSLLREISQTGSSLSSEGFEWIYDAIKEDLHFNSISGGTDINGCFAIGNPTIPVYSGEIQAPGLGMKIAAYDEEGKRVLDIQGELVCEAPSPSMPLYFWGDPQNENYLGAYFSFYKGVWRHGDYILIHSDTGGITFYGRSDAVLKPSGVRIGTAEIYNVVEKIPGIRDSVAVGQNWKGDQRIILFVQLSPGTALTEELKETIKQSLRRQASPRHVPALIIDVPGIPYTFSGKKVEIALTNLVNGRPVTNRDALSNPDILHFYEGEVNTLREE